LREGLSSDRRDVRLDAARALAALGDDSGREALRRLLPNPRQRVGAAGLLARIGDDEGTALLRKAAQERGSSLEVRMRAAVALGLAGDESVRETLRGILADGSYRVGAAEALAALGDEAAVPALEEQL